jgi:hypothetical protein
MAGLVPAIHDFLSNRTKDVDARHKAGHDGVGWYVYLAAIAAMNSAKAKVDVTVRT